ncbi:MAG: cysteine--1-D-myo-inosityl 2-amino-2-deoxy-alpha-D-glucopyranoside ligase, partial [Mycobacteriales bacterium]
WEWTAADLDAAQTRLAAWRSAVAAPAGPDAGPTLQRVREVLADGLDSPRALAAVDRWCGAVGEHRGDDAAAPGLIRDVTDALLGVLL